MNAQRHSSVYMSHLGAEGRAERGARDVVSSLQSSPEESSDSESSETESSDGLSSRSISTTVTTSLAIVTSTSNVPPWP